MHSRKVGFSVGMVILLGLAIFNTYWLATISNNAPRPWAEDYGIYYRAFSAAEQGESSYFPYRIGGSYVYHPATLTLVSATSGFGLLDEFAASVVWGLLNAIAYGAAVVICVRQFAANLTHRWALIAAFVVFAPFWEVIQIGQINGLVLCSLVGALALAERGNQLEAGLLLAFATVMKTTPAVFVLFFLASRQWSVILGWTSGLIILSLVAYLQFGLTPLVEFVSVSTTIATDPHIPFYNQSMQAFAIRVGGFGLSQPAMWLQRLISAGGLLVGVALLTAAPHPHMRYRIFALFMVVMTIASPLVWYHHAVFLVPALIFLLSTKQPVHVGAALTALFLIQSERLFEYIFQNPPASGLLIIAAQALIMVALVIPQEAYEPETPS